MASNPHLISYFVVTILYAFMPGPAMLYSIAQTLSGGKKVGMMAVLGLHIGGYVHVLLAVLGLSALLLTHPTVYVVIQQLGALYLIGMGLQRIYHAKTLRMSSGDAALISTRKTFVDSVIVDVLNPKAALFYLAFLPQFVDPSGPLAVGWQLLLLGCLTNILFSSADLCSVCLAAQLHKRLTNTQWLDFFSRWAGSIFILLGGLALARAG